MCVVPGNKMFVLYEARNSMLRRAFNNFLEKRHKSILSNLLIPVDGMRVGNYTTGLPGEINIKTDTTSPDN